MADKGSTSTQPKPTKKPPKENSALVHTYLIAYNVIQVFGWSYMLYQFVDHYTSGTQDKTLWDTVKWTVIIFQNAALLEVVHAAIGYVKSNPLVTFVQIMSRVQLVFVLVKAEPSQLCIGLPLCLTAWSITEIIRYSFYGCNLIKMVPAILNWLRYSTFLILYPVGITGELICLYYGQKYVKETGLFSIELPNAYNFTFSFAYFLWFAMFLYIPIFPKLFGHMLSQRKKALSIEGSNSKKIK